MWLAEEMELKKTSLSPQYMLLRETELKSIMIHQMIMLKAWKREVPATPGRQVASRTPQGSVGIKWEAG